MSNVTALAAAQVATDAAATNVSTALADAQVATDAAVAAGATNITTALADAAAAVAASNGTAPTAVTDGAAAVADVVLNSTTVTNDVASGDTIAQAIDDGTSQVSPAVLAKFEDLQESIQKQIEETGVTPSQNCLDVTEVNDKYCFGNVTWAMETGIKAYPTWYAEYPILSINNTFAAYQLVLADKVGDGDGVDDGKGWRCPFPCNLPVPKCAQITAASPGQCFGAVMWAKNVGIVQQPDYYGAWPGLNTNSSFEDFQYVLNQMIDNPQSNGTGWQCPMPCTSTYITTLTTTAAVTSTAGLVSTSAKDLVMPSSTSPAVFSTTTAMVGASDESSGFPWWGWLILLGVALLCCAGLVAAYMKYGTGKAKKTKRAMAVKAEAPPAAATTRIAAPAPAPAPVTYTAAPTYTAVPAPPVQLTAQPVQTVAAPAVQYAVVPEVQAPSVQMRAVPTYEVPIQATSMPMQMAYAAPAAAPAIAPMDRAQAAALFDQLDTNHDGTISRSEFARLMQGY